MLHQEGRNTSRGRHEIYIKTHKLHLLSTYWAVGTTDTKELLGWGQVRTEKIKYTR